MKISTALLALPASVYAYTAEEYASGAVHQRVMDIKNVCLAEPALLTCAIMLTDPGIGTLGP